MKTIDSYIIEKLHLTKDNKNLVTKDIDVNDFIDSVEGDYQKRVVKLLANVITYKKENPGSTCFIVKSILKRDGVEVPQYKWAESKNGKTLNIGEKTPAGSTVVFEVTDKTKIPSYWSALYLDEGLVSEKLHIDKDINIASNDNYEEMENIINEIISNSIGDDKYEVSFKHSNEEEIYIVITFEKTYSNTSIHNCGYKIFNKLYDEEKFISYGSGSDWWTSIDKKTNKTTIIIKLAYK